MSELQERFKRVAIEDHSLTFNTELTTALELSYMLDVAETIIQSALQRTESRGSHQRTDHPDRDDENFLAHSLAYGQEGAIPGPVGSFGRLGQIQGGSGIQELSLFDRGLHLSLLHSNLSLWSC